MTRVRIAEPFVVVPLWLVRAATPEALKLYVILYAVGSFTNPTKTITKKALAEQLGGVSIRTVDRWVVELVALGALAVESNVGNGAANTYELLSAERTTTEMTGGVGQNLPGGSVKNDRGSITNSSSQERSSAREGFDEFWNVYPRTDDKVKARKAWAGALRLADVETIVAGAARYRDDPNRDPAFTKLAATWLHAGSWDNGALPPRPENGHRRVDETVEYPRLDEEPVS